MSDTLMTILGIFIAVILMFILPLIMIANKNDEIAQTTVQMAVADFVNTVANQGKITYFDYDKLVQKLNSTGNAYDIQIEAQIIDDNPRRTTTTGSRDLSGENKYYSVYTNTILEQVEGEAQVYELKKDDYIIVSVKSTNITLATELKNLFYKLVGKETYAIGTSASALVLNHGNEEEKHIDSIKENKPDTYSEKKIVTKTIVTETIDGHLDLVVVLDCEETTMPWHNNNGTSINFIRNIVDAVSGEGNNVSFILTCNPTVLYTDLNNLSWIYNAYEDETSSNYVKAIQKALDTVKNKEGTRCIAFLSWEPYQSYLDQAINVLARNTSSFDLFCTTPCCSMNPYRGKWHESIPASKSAGHLIGSNIKDRFKTLLNKTETRIKDMTLESQDLKVKLEYFNSETETLSITVNNDSYLVGTSLPSYIIYKNAKGDYFLDLKLLGEVLGMTLKEWDEAVIKMEYVLK